MASARATFREGFVLRSGSLVLSSFAVNWVCQVSRALFDCKVREAQKQKLCAENFAKPLSAQSRAKPFAKKRVPLKSFHRQTLQPLVHRSSLARVIVLESLLDPGIVLESLLDPGCFGGFCSRGFVGFCRLQNPAIGICLHLDGKPEKLGFFFFFSRVLLGFAGWQSPAKPQS